MPATVPAAFRRTRVRELDLRRPSAFTRDQIRQLERSMDAWACSAASRRSAELREHVALGLAGSAHPSATAMAEERPREAPVPTLDLAPLGIPAPVPTPRP